jgi:hypothetical protein
MRLLLLEGDGETQGGGGSGACFLYAVGGPAVSSRDKVDAIRRFRWNLVYARRGLCAEMRNPSLWWN